MPRVLSRAQVYAKQKSHFQTDKMEKMAARTEKIALW